MKSFATLALLGITMAVRLNNVDDSAELLAFADSDVGAIEQLTADMPTGNGEAP